MNEMVSHARSNRPRRVRLDPVRWVSIRPIDAFDRPALFDFYARLSRESTRRRFLGSVSLTDRDVARMAAADGLVAVLRTSGPDEGAIVAHAELCPDGKGGGEAAFAVRDDLQGRGIGRAMVRGIVDHARRVGLERLTAVTYPDNRAMRTLLLAAGCPVIGDRIDAGVEEVELDLVSGASTGDAPAR